MVSHEGNNLYYLQSINNNKDKLNVFESINIYDTNTNFIFKITNDLTAIAKIKLDTDDLPYYAQKLEDITNTKKNKDNFFSCSCSEVEGVEIDTSRYTNDVMVTLTIDESIFTNAYWGTTNE